MSGSCEKNQDEKNYEQDIHVRTSGLELQMPRDGEQNQDNEHENQCIHGEDLLPPWASIVIPINADLVACPVPRPGKFCCLEL